MHPFTLIFLAALALMLATQWWLGGRQIAHVQARRERVPRAFEGQVPIEAHRKAADYTVARARLGRAEDLYGAAVLLLWTLGGGLALLDRAWRAAVDSQLYAGTLFLLSLLLVSGLLELPFAIARTFGIERRFGFNRTTAALFAVDLLKQSVLAILIGAPRSWTWNITPLLLPERAVFHRVRGYMNGPTERRFY